MHVLHTHQQIHEGFWLLLAVILRNTKFDPQILIDVLWTLFVAFVGSFLMVAIIHMVVVHTILLKICKLSIRVNRC